MFFLVPLFLVQINPRILIHFYFLVSVSFVGADVFILYFVRTLPLMCLAKGRAFSLESNPQAGLLG
jgi:hypothetical protein